MASGGWRLTWQGRQLQRGVSSGYTITYAYNPFRYRGYYYDVETGLYYLQSRYYHPAWGRFINADGYVNANGDWGLSKEADISDTLDFSYWNVFMNSGYNFHFTITVNLHEENDGYQEIDLYNT